MRPKTIILLLCFPLASHGQAVYKGTVINKNTRAFVPFATVGLVKGNIGVNADEQGRFTLGAGKYERDTLLISSVGYEPSTFPVTEFPADARFEIPEKKIALKEVILRNYKSAVTLNDYDGCGLNSYYSSGSMTQIVQPFQCPAVNALLSEINICKQGDYATFRIRLYDVDSISGKPSTNLADTVIEVRSGKRHVQVNLEKYHIIIPGKHFFIGIEWLYIPSNKSVIKVKRDGQKIPLSQFSPFIFLKTRKPGSDPSEKQLHAWQLDFRGQWLPMFRDWEFLISPTIKY